MDLKALSVTSEESGAIETSDTTLPVKKKKVFGFGGSTRTASVKQKSLRRSRNSATASTDADDSIKENILKEAFPSTTMEERLRFMASSDVQKASLKLTNYVKWRETNELDCTVASSSTVEEVSPNKRLSEEEDWHDAFRKATALLSEEISTSTLPQIVRLACKTDAITKESTAVFDKKDKRILQVLPALMDTKLASSSLYALCTSLYLDKKLDRNSTEKITIAVDVRPGRGWPNPAPHVVLPFVKAVSTIATDNFPERLERCIIFPVPKVAIGVWNMFKVFLHPKQVERMCLVSGGAHIHSKVPRKMNIYCGNDVIHTMEQERTGLFR